MYRVLSNVVDGEFSGGGLLPDATYKQLKRVSDWQMTEEAQRATLTALVHAISRLDTTLHWGEGRTSALAPGSTRRGSGDGSAAASGG